MAALSAFWKSAEVSFRFAAISTITSSRCALSGRCFPDLVISQRFLAVETGLCATQWREDIWLGICMSDALYLPIVTLNNDRFYNLFKINLKTDCLGLDRSSDILAIEAFELPLKKKHKKK